ncbi:unnamed protein product, partial [Symbiodinium sp. CCMP2592]
MANVKGEDDLKKASQKALDAAARRRQLAASVASVAANPDGGMVDATNKRSRPPKTPSTVNTETPSCKTPAPKHAKNLESVGDTPAETPTPSKQLFATPGQTPDPNKQLFATPSKMPAKGGSSVDSLEIPTPDVARQMHNDVMDSCPDTQVDLDVQIDHDLAKLSLETADAPQHSSNLGSGKPSSVADDAAHALTTLCDVLQQSPSEIQKALLRPGTVEFEAIAAAVKTAKLQEAQAQQELAAKQVPATQAMDSYLDDLYGNSHRCDSRSPPGMRPNAEPKPTEASNQAPQQKPKPAEASDQAPQQNKPAEASDQAPQQKPKPAEASDQAPQQKPITEASIPMDVDAPFLSKQVVNALVHVEPDQGNAEKALEQKPNTEPQQSMPPPSTVPVKATQATPSNPPSSAPSTPGPSDVEDDPELSALADVMHQMKEAARKTRMRFLRSFE